MRVAALLVVMLATSACNSVIGADAPQVQTPGGADDGADPPSDAAAPACGDGIIGAGETCDDANDDPSDGCHECQVECGPKPELLDPSTHHCFWFSPAGEAKSWDDALASCAGWGGTLASLADHDEFDLIHGRIAEDTWIGGHKTASGFEWADDEPWTFESWAPGHPTGAGACLILDRETAAFRLEDCQLPASYLCERVPAGKPE